VGVQRSSGFVDEEEGGQGHHFSSDRHTFHFLRVKEGGREGGRVSDALMVKISKGDGKEGGREGKNGRSSIDSPEPGGPTNAIFDRVKLRQRHKRGREGGREGGRAHTSNDSPEPGGPTMLSLIESSSKSDKTDATRAGRREGRREGEERGRRRSAEKERISLGVM